VNRIEFYQLDAKSSVATGTAFPCAHMINKWVQVGENAGGAINATVNIEVTIDGVSWAIVQTLTNQGGLVEVQPIVKQIRLNTTAWVSGTITGWLGGLMPRG
jgi:hypothetical protein